MSVLIKGVEMPKEGELLCIDIHPDGKVCIDMDLHCKQIATAVPVPPHGDLIDRDELSVFSWKENDVVEDSFDSGVLFVLDCVDALPTIIEAEECDNG